MRRLTLDRTIDHLGWRRRRSKRAATIAANRLARSIAPISTYTFRLGEHGRLGNQLFQIAGTIGLAAQMNSNAVFRKDWHYRDYFSLPTGFYASRITVARCAQAWPLAVGIAEEARLWLQDASLWEVCRESIDRWLQPSDLARAETAKRYSELLALPSKTSIHVRRGDYLAGPSPRTIPSAYYDETVQLIKADDPSTQFLVFSDDIGWCRKALPIPDALYISGNPDWLDLTLMSHCEHHICANSTFSWWGAYLSTDPSPIVPWLTGAFPPAFRIGHPDGWHEIEISPESP